MHSRIGETYTQIRKKTEQAGRVLVAFLIAALIMQTVGPVPGTTVLAAEEPSANGYLDQIVFGNADSESTHNLKGEFTSVITGFLGEPARVSKSEGSGCRARRRLDVHDEGRPVSPQLSDREVLGRRKQLGLYQHGQH